jgi:hypothetical protein
VADWSEFRPILAVDQRRSLDGYTVAVTGWLGYYQKLDVGTRPIVDLMYFPCCNWQALTGDQHRFDACGLNREDAAKDVEELVCHSVKVTNFRRLWWHAFLDDAQCRRLDEVPSIASVAPDVVRGRSALDRIHNCGVSGVCWR